MTEDPQNLVSKSLIFSGLHYDPLYKPSEQNMNEVLPPFSVPLGLPKREDLENTHITEDICTPDHILDEFIREVPIEIQFPVPNLIKFPQLNLTTDIEPIPLAMGSTETRILLNDSSIHPLSTTLQEYELPSLEEGTSMLFSRRLNKEKNILGDIHNKPFLPGGTSIFKVKEDTEDHFKQSEVLPVLKNKIDPKDLTLLQLSYPFSHENSEIIGINTNILSIDDYNLPQTQENSNQDPLLHLLFQSNILENTTTDIYGIHKHVGTTTFHSNSIQKPIKEEPTDTLDSLFEIETSEPFFSPSLQPIETSIPLETQEDIHIDARDLNQLKEYCIQDIDQLIIKYEEQQQLSKALNPSTRTLKSKNQFYIEDKTDVTDFHQLLPHMALQYPFELDTFQKRAILHVQKHEIVYVCAHTSAGKTVIAEYAIALCKQHSSKCIYTSPIKALSNQKYRDFKLKFNDVGLITGDNTINPTASCLIMTTEILRNMLYRGADLIRDVECVIFDEAHYLNDDRRGVVWEESIIMLPATINMVFLSATTPNSKDICDWIGRTKKQIVYIVETQQRPVPLEHHIWWNHKDIVIYTEKGQFLDQNYKLLFDNHKIAKNQIANPNNLFMESPTPEDINQLVQHLIQTHNLPCVMFTFSRDDCNRFALFITSTTLVTQEEQKKIHSFIQKCLHRLNKSDQLLNQVQLVVSLLLKGVGIHHAGLLPILKEMVEILYQMNYVKVLFATETFAMGVNMPTKCVVFNGVVKYSDQGRRLLETTEYIQMSGRAGRRGLDKKGTVIIANYQRVLPLESLRTILCGQQTTVTSKFKISYSMLLNLLRSQDLSIEGMIQQSFSEVSKQRNIEQFDYKNILNKLKQDIDRLEMCIEPCIKGGPTEIEDFYKDEMDKEHLLSQIYDELILSNSNVFKSGAFIYISTQLKNSHCIITGPALLLSRSTSSQSVTFSLLFYIPESMITQYSLKPVEISKLKSVQVENLRDKVFCCNSLYGIITNVSIESTPVRLLFKNFKKDLGSLNNLYSIQRALKELNQLYTQISIYNDEDLYNININSTLFDISTLKKIDIKVAEMYEDYKELCSQISKLKCSHCSKQKERMELIKNITDAKQVAREIEEYISTENIENLGELRARLKVLRELHYMDSKGILTSKGKAGCYLEDECIVPIEMIYQGFFNHISPSTLAAMVSCLCIDKPYNNAPIKTEELREIQDKLTELLGNLFTVQSNMGMDLDMESYMKHELIPSMMQATYDWCEGYSFKYISESSSIPEGIIVRCLISVDQTLNKIREVAKTMGNPELEELCIKACKLLERDIVFSPSLYVTDE